MNVTAIFFSPAGGTKKTMECLAKYLKANGIKVQLLDMTGDKAIFPQKDYEKFFKRVIPHDLLIIGGPVYIDHIHYNVADLIKALPAPGDKWGDKACMVASFGKVTPGVALAEMSQLLKKSGRKNIAALNIDSEHCISRVFTEKISAGLPADEIEAICKQAAKDLSGVLSNKLKTSEHLDLYLQKQYEDFPELTDEKTALDTSFPKPAIDYAKCSGCLKCVKVCPVRCLQEKEGKPYVTDASTCIHCANCLVNCPKGAVLMDLAQKEPYLMKKLSDHGYKPDSPSRSEYIFIAAGGK